LMTSAALAWMRQTLNYEMKEPRSQICWVDRAHIDQTVSIETKKTGLLLQTGFFIAQLTCNQALLI